MVSNQALLQIVHEEPSYCFGTRSTRVCVTRQGGMMAPVQFFADSDAPIQPYYIAPWTEEGCPPDTLPVLTVVRGDFFCAPFGGSDEPVDGVIYPAHGEPANMPWRLVELKEANNGAALVMEQAQTLRAGKIRKTLAVREGESVIYARHDLEGMSGPMSLGHHATLFIPDEAEPGYLSFAPHRHAHTYVKPTESPENKGYSALKPDAAIEDLARCPLANGSVTDLTRYPARRGYEDIFIVCAQPDLEFGWTAISQPSRGFVWFGIKDPRMLASTLVWMSNGGRHYPPWNGRNVNTIGLEEVTGFFHEGLAASSRENMLSAKGVPTHVALDAREATRIPYIQGIARIHRGFTQVRAIEPIDENTLRLVSIENESVEVKVAWKFVREKKLEELID